MKGFVEHVRLGVFRFAQNNVFVFWVDTFSRVKKQIALSLRRGGRVRWSIEYLILQCVPCSV